MIYLGADHRGYRLKEKLRVYLQDKGYEVTDLGTDSEEPVDYPIVAEKVAGKVLGNTNNRGIVICGSGAGVCIAANKFKGIRAAHASDPAISKAAREDDNINILCLASDATDFETGKKVTQAFLDTSFSGAERHKRRLSQIAKFEKNN